MAILPLMISPEAAQDALAHSDILLVAVMQQAVFTTRHISGSILVESAELMSGAKSAVGKALGYDIRAYDGS